MSNIDPTPTPPPVIHVTMPAKPPSNPLAMASIITSIASLPLLFCCGIGMIGSVAAIALGVMGFFESKKSGVGKEYALTGATIGAAVLFLFVVILMAGGIQGPPTL